MFITHEHDEPFYTKSRSRLKHELFPIEVHDHDTITAHFLSCFTSRSRSLFDDSCLIFSSASHAICSMHSIGELRAQETPNKTIPYAVFFSSNYLYLDPNTSSILKTSCSFIVSMFTALPSGHLSRKDIEQLVEQKDESISFIKPKETAKTSKYWSHFSQIYFKNDKQNFIVCDRCRSILVYKSSTGSGCMMAHSRACELKENGIDSSGQQSLIDTYYKSMSINKSTVPKRIKDAITAKCVEFVVQDGRPFHLFEGAGFHQLAKQLFDAGRLMASSKNFEFSDLIPDPSTVCYVYCVR